MSEVRSEISVNVSYFLFFVDRTICISSPCVCLVHSCKPVDLMNFQKPLQFWWTLLWLQIFKLFLHFEKCWGGWYQIKIFPIRIPLRQFPYKKKKTEQLMKALLCFQSFRLSLHQLLTAAFQMQCILTQLQDVEGWHAPSIWSREATCVSTFPFLTVCDERGGRRRADSTLGFGESHSGRV